MNIQNGEEVAVKLVSVVDTLSYEIFLSVLFIYQINLSLIRTFMLEEMVFLSCSIKDRFCNCGSFFNTLIRSSCEFFFQEPVKTKHPQLQFESKIYMLLQGGSKPPKFQYLII